MEGIKVPIAGDVRGSKQPEGRPRERRLCVFVVYQVQRIKKDERRESKEANVCPLLAFSLFLLL
jgi:hypothetical protein